MSFRRAAALTLLGSLIALFGGCATGARTPSTSSRVPNRVITVRVKDFTYQLPNPLTVRAGRVTFRLVNLGPSRHELIVVRAPDHLPLRTDDLTVNEERLGSSGLHAIEPLKPHHTGSISVRLRPGRYQLFCNLAGHYLGGMHHELRVIR